MNLSPEDKIRLLRELTRGADDVFAVRTDGVWRPVYSSLPDKYLMMHMQGHVEIGSYPLIPTETSLPTVWWVAADFDGKRPGSIWENDAKRALQFLSTTKCPLFVNRSRSSKGVHVRVLFNEPVPAWMARRWMMAWLDEAGVVKEPGELNDDGTTPSFDRTIPPQDSLSGRLNDNGYRLPGNLIGSPMHGQLARKNGGTLPVDLLQAIEGRFDTDGLHWEHLVAALDGRTWGRAELQAAMADAPGVDLTPPQHRSHVSLPMLKGTGLQLETMVNFCAFLQHVRTPGNFTYELWLALATQLHPYGEAGYAAFHEISAIDRRYDSRKTDLKWEQTRDMHPMRCDTLIMQGYRCPHLGTKRCAGARSPAYFARYALTEVL